jgi:rare lipoprotein A (peptidoglycan hydrolase)
VTRTPGARVALLGAVALAAAAVAIGVVVGTGRDGPPAPPGVGPWYAALAAPYAPAKAAATSACGVRVGPTTVGVAHPVLPCGAKLVVRYRGRTVQTRVVERSPSVPGRELDLTRALARALRLQGTRTIRWRFAR